MRTGRALVIVALLAAGLLSASAGWVSSDAPDGLERVAQDQGFSDRAEPSPGLFDGYGVPGIEHSGLSTAVAGIIGIAAVAGVTIVAGRLLRARRPEDGPSDIGRGA